MLLTNWLALFQARLQFSRFVRRMNGTRSLPATFPPFVRGGQGGSRSRARKQHDNRLLLAAEVLEVRQLLSAAVTAVSPNSGSQNGGTSVNLVGSGFTGVTTVMFGSQAASQFTVNSVTSITAVSPAEATGTVDIQVDTTSGNSPIVSADQFTFLQAPPSWYSHPRQ